jgi:hypothetical protein
MGAGASKPASSFAQKIAKTGGNYLKKEASELRESIQGATSQLEFAALNSALNQNAKDQEAFNKLSQSVTEQQKPAMSDGMSAYSAAMADLGGQTDYADKIRAEQEKSNNAGKSL